MTLSTQTASTHRVSASTVDVIPTGAALGAEVRGVDLRDLDEAAFADVMQVWHDHSVLLFRNQTLSDKELIAFSRRLGDLDWERRSRRPAVVSSRGCRKSTSYPTSR